MSVALRNRVPPWKSFLFKLREQDGFFLFICLSSCSGCIGELCEDFKRYHLFFPLQWYSRSFLLYFLISTSCFKENISQNNFNWSSSLLYQTQDIRQTLGLSSPIFLLTKVTIWTSQLLVQNWSKTPLSARSSVSRRIHVCPSTWQIWMITLTICYVNCFHLTITPIQTSSSATIFGITTVLW